MTSHDPVHFIIPQDLLIAVPRITASRPSSIRVAPQPLLQRHRSHRPTLLSTHLQTCPPDFFIPSREDSLRGEAQISTPAALPSNALVAEKAGPFRCARAAAANISALLRLFMVPAYQEELLEKRWREIHPREAGDRRMGDLG